MQMTPCALPKTLGLPEEETVAGVATKREILTWKPTPNQLGYMFYSINEGKYVVGLIRHKSAPRAHAVQQQSKIIRRTTDDLIMAVALAHSFNEM
jgi:hypothetical protein